MDNEKMRAEFEAWFTISAKWYGNQDDLDWDGEEYSGGDIQLAFEAWQASRAAIVVELPNVETVAVAMTNDWLGYSRGVRQCREAIQSTGLKVKPWPN